MCSQLRRPLHKSAHQTLGVILTALGTLMAENAACQNQPLVQPTPAQRPAANVNQLKRPAAPNAQARPVPAQLPKPSLWQRFTGGAKAPTPNTAGNPMAGNPMAGNNPTPQQQHFWQKLPLLNGRSAGSQAQSRPATATQSTALSKLQPGSAGQGSRTNMQGPRDTRSAAQIQQGHAAVGVNRSTQYPASAAQSAQRLAAASNNRYVQYPAAGAQAPQRLAALGSNRSMQYPGAGTQSQQRLAMIGPNRSMQNPGWPSPAPQSRSFPHRPGMPYGGEARMPNGNVVRTAPDGSVTDMHISQHNMLVHYGLSGSRQVRVEQPDGSRIVLASRGVPYVQKPWNFAGSAYDHRTFLNNGQLTHQFYRPYSYADTTLDVYAPQRFYSEEFYQWAAKPQAWTPPTWTYVTRQEPWYTHYHSYFTAQPSYSTPVQWLADFVLATSLFEAYNAHSLPTRAPPTVPTLPASTPLTTTQTRTAAVPVVQSPIARTAALATSTAVTGAAQSPIVGPPASVVTTAQTLRTVPAVMPVGGASLTLWERFTNFIRGLFGVTGSAHETPQTAVALVPPPLPAELAVAAPAAPITADVKALVADEVGRQIEEESREARGNAQGQEVKPGAGGIVEELRRPTQHVFVVASDLDLVDDTGRRCMISEGDVVQIVSTVNANSSSAQGVVLSSKGGVECAHAATVDIAVSDLQEMQNHMRATIDQGLANTTRGATEPTVTPAFAAAAPPPDAEAKNAIEQQKAIAVSVDRG
jgi:hypothetical protein